MAAVRNNVVTDDVARDQYIQVATLLKGEFLGPTTQDLGIPGPAVQVSTYDLLLPGTISRCSPSRPPPKGTATPPIAGLSSFRGIASCSSFSNCSSNGCWRRGLRHSLLGLGGRRRPERRSADRRTIWSEQCIGGQGDPVTTGPFAFDADDPTSWRVRVEQASKANSALPIAVFVGPLAKSSPRCQERLRSKTRSRCPSTTLHRGTPSAGFHDRVEGWQPVNTAPGLHNRVHVWVGGDMLPSSSPNDPVFYLNHCNEDRIWAAWQTQPGASYLPDQTAPTALRGHRIDDAMHALLSDPVTP